MICTEFAAVLEVNDPRERGRLSDCSSVVQIPHPSAVLQHHYYYCAWARRSDACTLQVNKECHWQPGGKKREEKGFFEGVSPGG